MIGTDGAPRILIARLSAIGDCILTLPLACALRRQLPEAFIAWVVQSPAHAFVDGHAAIDRTVVLDRSWLRRPAALAAARRELRALEVDIALDPQSLTKSALAAWLSGAHRRIGLAGEHGRELSGLVHTERVRPERSHVVDRSLELLRPLGLEPGPVEWNVPLARDDEASVDAALDGLGLAPRGFAVVNPGATWPSKLWPTDRHASVCRHLSTRHGLPVLVTWHGAAERALADAIVGDADGAARPAPALSLGQLASLLRRARVFVGSDTGPLHLAVAVGTPSIGLYGPTRPRDCGPYGEPHVALQARYQDGTRRERRAASNDALREIDAAWVNETLDGLLGRTSTQR